MIMITGILPAEEWLHHLSPLLSPPWNPLPLPHLRPLPHPQVHPRSNPLLPPLRQQQNL